MPITIPDKHYVGFKQRASDSLPLGFATPFSADKAFEKRKGTVDGWAVPESVFDDTTKQWVPGERIPAQLLDNVLMDGFQIAKSVRRHGWNGGNVVWRIQDPRGFELEISSSNMASILDCSTVINGEIQGKCIWGRDGAANLLLPEMSDPYKQAVFQTELKKSSLVSIQELSFGDVVYLHNTKKAIYLGRYHTIVTRFGDPATTLKIATPVKHLLFIFDSSTAEVTSDIDIFSSRFVDLCVGRKGNPRVGSFKVVDKPKVSRIDGRGIYTLKNGATQEQFIQSLMDDFMFRFDLHEDAMPTIALSTAPITNISTVIVPVDESILEWQSLDYYQRRGSDPLVVMVPKGDYNKLRIMHTSDILVDGNKYGGSGCTERLRRAAEPSIKQQLNNTFSTILPDTIPVISYHNFVSAYAQQCMQSWSWRSSRDHLYDELIQDINKGCAWYTLCVKYNDGQIKTITGPH